jgi:predicted CopG family antitoxin
MARTIMISDGVYEELKKEKGSDKSFSTVIKAALDDSHSRKKLGSGLKDVMGILKDDSEYDHVMRYAKKKWKEWGKRYA